MSFELLLILLKILCFPLSPQEIHSTKWKEKVWPLIDTRWAALSREIASRWQLGDCSCHMGMDIWEETEGWWLYKGYTHTPIGLRP